MFESLFFVKLAFVRILLVENNISLASLIKKHLSRLNVVDHTESLVKARFFLDGRDYDLLLTDFNLDDGDSFELLSYLKLNKIDLPILFLTADSSQKNKINFLENGRDFLLKPFSMLELEAKIKLLLQKPQQQESLLEFEDIVLKPKSYEVSISGKEVKLNRKEFALFELFLTHPNQIFDKATLAEKIWQEDGVLFGNSSAMTVSHLRQKIGRDLIKTVKGVGYSLKRVF